MQLIWFGVTFSSFVCLFIYWAETMRSTLFELCVCCGCCLLPAFFLIDTIQSGGPFSCVIHNFCRFLHRTNCTNILHAVNCLIPRLNYKMRRLSPFFLHFLWLPYNKYRSHCVCRCHVAVYLPYLFCALSYLLLHFVLQFN